MQNLVRILQIEFQKKIKKLLVFTKSAQESINWIIVA